VTAFHGVEKIILPEKEGGLIRESEKVTRHTIYCSIGTTTVPFVPIQTKEKVSLQNHDPLQWLLPGKNSLRGKQDIHAPTHIY